MKMWKAFTNFVFWSMQTVSWVLALYLFATGEFWGGVGCAFIACGMFFVRLIVFVIAAPDFAEAMREGREKAKQAAYEDELRKRKAC